MPGFVVSNLKFSFNKEKYIKNNTVFDQIKTDKIVAYRNTLNKFLDDKLFYNDENYIIIIDGVILNKKQLLEKNNDSSILDYILNSKLLDNDFFNDFRGSFVGFVYDKNQGKFVSFTNHFGDYPIYYYHDNNYFVISTDINYILDVLKQNAIKLTLSIDACYQILTFGYMESDKTYANEIKRLLGGFKIVSSEGDFRIERYHEFIRNSNKYKNLKNKEIIELVDKIFTNSIKLEYDKDNEYGYKHLAEISGGLDSRMNVWIASEVNKEKLDLITFGKAGCLDQLIAQKIARKLGHNLLFQMTDDLGDIPQIEANVFRNAGLSLYIGAANERRMLERLNLDEYGILHNGEIGDVVLSSVVKNVKKQIVPDGLYSRKLKDRLDVSYKKSFSDKELYFLFTRGFNGAPNTHQLERNYVETVSPFMNVEFFQLCIDLPVSYRRKHKLYKEWIINKYPEAARIPWEKISGSKITSNRLIVFTNKFIKKGIPKVLRKIGLKRISNYLFQKYDMNPYDYWLSNNESKNRLLIDYIDNNACFVKELTDNIQLYDDIIFLKNGNAFEKIMVVTLLASLKLYFE